eukprot:Partr_v1_DN29000_c0_g1_i1_m25164 putative insulin-degrading enzyme
MSESLIKPLLDDRHYRTIFLPNGLQCLLVNDQHTDKASAALDVHVGSYLDPEDFPGLAHFLEHMLFMGTEKYPKENEYTEYLNNHGGSSNAYTSAVNTNYYFEVNHDHFDGALDRFAQFFVAPLFLRDAVDRELMAVDSEFKKNLSIDSRRAYAVRQALAEPSHPFSKFASGNLQSLKEQPLAKGLDVVKALLDFYAARYSANIMKLVVVGRENLDVLESMVSKYFSSIVNKNLPAPIFDGHPLGSSCLKKLCLVKPLKETRRLVVEFALPDFYDQWKSKPCSYFTHLLGHESQGSILALLKDDGWATALWASSGTSARGFDILSVGIDLTSAGLSKWKEVLTVVFQYIRLVVSTEVKQWIYDENAQTSKISFQFREESSASSFASHTSSLMHDYPPEYTLFGPYCKEDFQPSLIELIMKKLTPENATVAVMSKSFSEESFGPDSSWTWLKEKWYQTDYAIRPLDAAFLDSLSKCGPNPKLYLPERNPFLPKDLVVGPEIDIDESQLKPNPPKVVFVSEFSRFWYKKDSVFRVPKTGVGIMIRSPNAYTTAYHSVLTKLYVDLVTDSLSEYAYMAEMADLHYSIEVHPDGISATVYGFTDKIFVLVHHVLEKLRKMKCDENRYNVRKEKLRHQYENAAKDAAHSQAAYYMSFFVQEKLFMSEEKARELDIGLSFEDFCRFADDFFKQIHVEVLVHGSVEREVAIANMHRLCKDLITPTDAAPSRPLPVQAFSQSRSHVLPSCSDYVFMKHLPERNNLNSASEYYVQCGSSNDSQSRALCYVIRQLMQDPAFDQLRTKEQLGYIVWASQRRSVGVIGLRIILMGDHDSIYLEQRIEAFLHMFRDEILENVTHETLDKIVEAVVGNLIEKDKSLIQESTRWWKHIRSGYFNFFEVPSDVDMLKKITKKDVLAYYDQYVGFKSPSRAKLSVHFRSLAPPKALREILKGQDESAVTSLMSAIEESTGASLTIDEFYAILSKLVSAMGENEQIDEALLVGKVCDVITSSGLQNGYLKLGSHPLQERTVLISPGEIIAIKASWTLAPAATPVDASLLRIDSLSKL